MKLMDAAHSISAGLVVFFVRIVAIFTFIKLPSVQSELYGAERINTVFVCWKICSVLLCWCHQCDRFTKQNEDLRPF